MYIVVKFFLLNVHGTIVYEIYYIWNNVLYMEYIVYGIMYMEQRQNLIDYWLVKFKF